ncbi:helix-turn-helix transcriptional regulator [Herbidospora cretacea]|uniref:helix-turn-helix transcriptional regulator n=1 Tax=Herbidospora cretacea TaxID=28444 RepID=UPI0004C2C5E0|nr:LuxR family transcriptional regulator [Herbidospora cretacea]
MNTPGLSGPFVGRTEHLATFGRALADRRCRGMVISGRTGVGKSRLAEECLAAARRDGAAVATVLASEAAGAVPLAALAHLLPAGVDLSDPVAGFAGVGEWLSGRGVAAGRRMVVLVDDLPLLDAASVMLIRQLMDAGQIWLLGTMRSTQRLSALVETLCEDDAVWRVELPELSGAEVEDLLVSLLGGTVSHRTLSRLRDVCGGNPLFLRELVTGAMARGALARDGEVWELADGAVPRTARLTELITARLPAADGEARRALELLAFCEPLSVADVEQTTPGPVIADLERSGVIRVIQDERRLMVTLAHPLYGEVLRAGVTQGRKAAMLLAHADRIASLGSRRRHDTLRIASWRLAATGTADPGLLTRAAALALHAHDNVQAGRLLRAIPAGHHTFTTQVMLGDALFQLSDFAGARAAYAAADALAETEQDVLTLTLKLVYYLLLGEDATEQAFEVGDAARARVTSDDGRRLLRHIEGAARVVTRDPRAAMALLADVEEDHREASNKVVWVVGAGMKAHGLAVLGQAPEALTWAERAYRGHTELDDQVPYLHPAVQLTCLTRALCLSGRIAEARQVGRAGYTALVTSGTLDFTQIWVALGLARAEWHAGRPADARAIYAEALALARSNGHNKPLRSIFSGLAACAAVQGDRDAAMRAVSEAREQVSGDQLYLEHLGFAWTHAMNGRPEAAHAWLAEAAARARAAGELAEEGLLLIELARLGGAKAAAARLDELAGVTDCPLIQAGTTMTTGLTTGDPGLLLAAAIELGEMGADLMAAEAAAAAAGLWRRAGQERRATAAANRSADWRARCQHAATPLLPAAAPAAALSDRELEIALLATRRITSREIAQTLQLSVRTVNNHLQHVYAKLGVSTRGGLIAALGRDAR